MARLFGRTYERRALELRTGELRQIAGITSIAYDDGRARATRALLLRSGGGLEVEIVIDRALDVAFAAYRGLPLVWRAPGGVAHPSYAQPGIEAFERNFFGGLLTTCGLAAFGPPGSDADGAWQQHGYVNHAPAESAWYRTVWEDDDCFFEAGGVVREARMFGNTLRLERTWRAPMGGTTLHLHDRVTNEGGGRSPHMLLYHCNAGFPLVDDSTQLRVTHRGIRPRDEQARAGLDLWDRGGPPQSDFKEQVFIHEPLAGPDGWASACVQNTAADDGRGAALTVRYRPDELPALFTWRMLGTQTYVMAMEPANCPTIEGRVAARKLGTLPFLEPGESRDYNLVFEAGPPAIHS